MGMLALLGCSMPEYADNEIVMYSQTNCEFCAAKRELFIEMGISFEERFIDTSKVAQIEMYQKLRGAGIFERSVGTPVIEVNGHMFPGNPSMKVIKPYLRVKTARE